RCVCTSAALAQEVELAGLVGERERARERRIRKSDRDRDRLATGGEAGGASDGDYLEVSRDGACLRLAVTAGVGGEHGHAVAWCELAGERVHRWHRQRQRVT